jgi:G patch domain/KOW motif-containing protein
MAEPKKISFGLGKSKQAVLRAALQSKTPVTNADSGEAIKGFASGFADPENPKEEAKELVIPMVKVNKWAQPAPKSDVEQSDVELTDDQKAVQAIIEKAERHEQGEREDIDDIGDIPLLMQNRAPGTIGIEDDELKFKTDVALRPEVCTAEEYENTPIEQFGAAMLRGMGWKEGEAIGGINKGLAEPIEFVPRPHGLGLGATRNLQIKPDRRRRARDYIKPGEKREEVTSVSSKRGVDGKVRHIKGVSETLVEAEDLRLKRGAYVMIQSGAHEQQVGSVTKLHNMMLDVKLSLSNVTVTVDESRCKVIGRQQHKDQLQSLKDGKVSRSSKSAKRPQDNEYEPSKSSKQSRVGSVIYAIQAMF